MRTFVLFLVWMGVTTATSGQVKAAVVFTFTESAGNVTMTSSGTIDTADLVSTRHYSWNGTDVFNSNTDLMGGTDVGGTDTGFAFHAGTDFSAWQSGNPWDNSFVFSSFTGTKGFSTYVGTGPYSPGLNVLASQLDGTLWSPDQNWTATGQTFASIGLNPGSYSVSDAVTGATITYQISAVPEPTTFTLLAFASIGVVLMGRRSRCKASAKEQRCQDSLMGESSQQD